MIYLNRFKKSLQLKIDKYQIYNLKFHNNLAESNKTLG